MKAKALLIASLCAMSLSLVACGGSTDETPASEIDTTMNATETTPSTPTADTTAATTTPATTDTAAAATVDTTTVTDTTAK